MIDGLVPPGPLPGGVIQSPYETRFEAHLRGLTVEQQRQFAALSALERARAVQPAPTAPSGPSVAELLVTIL